MKKITIIALAVLSLCSCGKKVTSTDLEAAQRYFNAWVHVQMQDHKEYLWKETELGSYILEDQEGAGPKLEAITDSMYIRVSYTQTLQTGDISGSTYEHISKQLGTYDETYYYGPVTAYAKGQYAGFEEALLGMRDGGRRKVLIPSWLMTYSRFDTKDGYLSQKTDDIGTTAIYDIELVEHFENIMPWSVDSLGRYLAAIFPAKYGSDPVKAQADSSGAYGFYYVSTKAPADDIELKDTTVYINYIGRLLNGRVFDTTIRDTAIRYGLSRDKTYEPVSITLGDHWSDVKMGSSSSSVIQGFARTLCQMGPFEKGSGIFISTLGYSYKGSGYSIPAYAPLRFDVELVENPNK